MERNKSEERIINPKLSLATRAALIVPLVLSACEVYNPTVNADSPPEAQPTEVLSPPGVGKTPGKTVEAEPTQTISPTVEIIATQEAFLGSPDNTFLAVPGVPEGFGGTGEISELVNNQQIQDNLNTQGYAPVVSSRGVLSRTQTQDGSDICTPNLPDKLFNPDVASGEDTKISSESGIVSYGDSETGEVRTKAIGVVSTSGIPDEWECVNAVVVDEDNPAGLSALRTLIIDTEGNIKAETPAAFSGEDNVEIRWENDGPKLYVNGNAVNFTFREGIQLEEMVEEEKLLITLRPEEIFGKHTKDTSGNWVVEGGLYPELYEAFYQYNGTEDEELKQFLLDQRLVLLQEHGKDTAGLGTSEEARDAYLELIREINKDREKGDYVHALLSPHEVHQYIQNIGNIRNEVTFEEPAVKGYKTPRGHYIGGFGGWIRLTPGVDYKGYYFDSKGEIQFVPPEKGIAEYYGISGLPEAVVYDFDKDGRGLILLVNTNPPNKESNIVPITFFRRRLKQFRAGSEYDERDGRQFSIDDSISSSVLDIWRGFDISTGRREKLNPSDLWEIIEQQLMITTEKGNQWLFFAAGFPPEAANTAQTTDDIIAMMPIARIVNVFER